MQESPFFSVVVPVYNGERFVARAVESALAQTFGDLEVLVVDDASTDSTPVVLEQLAARDARVRVVRHAANKRSFEARRTGATEARGRYLVYLDADDELSPEVLEFAYARLAICAYDIVQFPVAVEREGYASTEDLASAAAFFVVPDGLVEGEDIVHAMFSREQTRWNVYGKAMEAGLVRRAHAQLPERGLFYGDDCLAMFAVACEARTLFGCPQAPAYRYKLDTGLSNTREDRMRAFESVARDARLVVDEVRAYLERTGRFREFEDDYRFLWEHFLVNAVDRIENLLPAEQRPGGLDAVLEWWPAADVAGRLAQICAHDVLRAYAELVPAGALADAPAAPGGAVALFCGALETDLERGMARRAAESLLASGRPVVAVFDIRGTADVAGGASGAAVAAASGAASGAAVAAASGAASAACAAAGLPAGVEARCIEPLDVRGEGGYRARARAVDACLAEAGASAAVLCGGAAGSWPVDALACKLAGACTVLYAVRSFTCLLEQGMDAVQAAAAATVADALVCTSAAEAVWWRNVCRRVLVDGNPVGVEAPACKQSAEEQPSAVRGILWTGALVHGADNPYDIIPIMKRVVRRVPDAVLYMVGPVDAEYRKHFVQWMAQDQLLQSVDILGPDADLEAVCAQCALQLDTRRTGCYPADAAWGLSLGLPCVAYATTAFPWRQFGAAAVPVAAGDVERAADEMCALLLDADGLAAARAAALDAAAGMAQEPADALWEAAFGNASADAGAAGAAGMPADAGAAGAAGMPADAGAAAPPEEALSAWAASLAVHASRAQGQAALEEQVAALESQLDAACARAAELEGQVGLRPALGRIARRVAPPGLLG